MGGGDRVPSTGHVKRSDKNYAIALELRDRVVGSGPAQQAMLSEGSGPGNPPKQTFELNFFFFLNCMALESRA